VRQRWLAALLLAATPAAAAPPLDYIEQLFGATNVNAVAGHGGLTAGVSAEGDLTVLSWPGPGLYDQLAYLSSNDPAARAKPHFGAADGMGSFLGLRLTTAAGTRVAWLRGPSFTHTQGYSKPDAAVPVTTFTSAADGLTVTLTDVVSPDVDVLTRHVRVTRAPGSPVTAAELVVYENLSPTSSRVPEVPLADWALDGHADYLAAWDAKRGAILHLHPDDREQFDGLLDLLGLGADVDFGPAEALLRQTAPDASAVAALVDGLDASYPPGVAALVTTSPLPTSHQVGGDRTPICEALDGLIDNLTTLAGRDPTVPVPISPSSASLVRCTDQLPRLADAHGWGWRPEDALADLADGALSGSSLAAAQTNGALIAPLVFNGDTAEGEALFAFGATVAAAQQALAAAQTKGFAARQAAAEGASHDALALAPRPDPALGARVAAVAERALVNLYVAHDRQSSAFLASVTRQPPYALDWPRDGAFLTLAADLAGRSDWVTARDRWYAGLARTASTTGEPALTPLLPTDPQSGAMELPAGAWEMNYYVDGEAGGPIRFEIDNTALHVWALATHAAALGPTERRAFLDAVWPSARAAVELIARWKEKDSDLPAPANEDDNSALTSTLHGAVAVHAGLIAGARLAHAVGDDAAGRRYLARARALNAAIVASYYDAASGRFRAERGVAGGPEDAIGGWVTGWLIWPGRVLGTDDPRAEAQLAGDLDGILAILNRQKAGGTYVAKNILAGALRGKPDGARAKARQALIALADVATPGTDAFGEVFLSVDEPSVGQVGWSNRTATPHVWEGVLFYLSAIALTEPKLFDVEERELPLPVDAGGCGVAGGGASGGALLALFVLLTARSRSSAGRAVGARRPGPASTSPPRPPHR
jgi:hypothetical protein